MNNDDFKGFVKALDELSHQKGMNKTNAMAALKKGIATVLTENKGEKGEIQVEIDIDEESNDISFWKVKTVVEQVASPAREICLDEARLTNPDCVLYDVIRIPIDVSKFTRVQINTIKNIIKQQISTARKSSTTAEYNSRRSEICVGTVRYIDTNGTIFVRINDGTDGVISTGEQVANEEFHAGDIIRAEILRIDPQAARENRTNGIPLSRCRPGLVIRLLENQIPEMERGIIVVEGIAREAGEKTKVAVSSRDEDIPAVGTCLGPASQRIKIVADQLFGEKIDIIEWSSDPSLFIANALSPAKVIAVSLNEDDKIATVMVSNDNYSMAIGRRGINAKLAAKLTGWKIDVKTATESMNEMPGYDG